MKGGNYLRAQCRRALRVLPQMLILSLLLLAVGMLLGQMLTQRSREEPSKQKTQVGVVADRSIGFVSEIFDGLENFDASRFALDFIFMDEEEALRRLRAKELSAYIVVPDDFVDSVYAGQVDPVRYVTLSGASGTTAQLLTEVADAVSRVFLEAESALVGARNYVVEALPKVDADASDFALADRYTALTLSRDKFYRVEILGYAASLSTEGYYFCGIGTLFLMLWAISCSPLFSRRSKELCRVLTVRGLGPGKQVVCEFLPFLALMLLGLGVILAASGIFFRLYGAEPPSLEPLRSPRAWPVLLGQVMMLCAMEFFLYEVESSPVEGILLQFLCAVAQGYICGCVYPYSFFPKGVQLLGSLLPAGIAIRSFTGILSGEGGAWGFAALYALVFLALSVLLRRRRVSR